jgi:poly(3-hydroxybutyrate) depolymerase
MTNHIVLVFAFLWPWGCASDGDTSTSAFGGASTGGVPGVGAAGSGGGGEDPGVTPPGTGGTTNPDAADAGGPSPCAITSSTAECHSSPIVTITTGTDSRRVYWARPVTEAPPAGHPTVILFQGSFFGPATSWDVALARGTTPFGGDVQVLLVAALLDHGYTVVQPEAQGGIAWNTNGGTAYDTTPDAVFIPKLLAQMESGAFGPIDGTHLYATGISSGGYMTSRMAVSYAGKFRALVIESGSYATCLGPLCSIPSDLPADHPPTLFLHGGADGTVPIATAQAYDAALKARGIETKFVEDAAAGHQWITTAPSEVLAWFSAH